MERRFNISNGSRKYKLNTDVYAMKQNNSAISKYYIRIRGIWEELDAMSDLPRITVINEEIANFLQVLTKQQEEQKLFQFLNGLDEE